MISHLSAFGAARVDGMTSQIIRTPQHGMKLISHHFVRAQKTSPTKNRFPSTDPTKRERKREAMMNANMRGYRKDQKHNSGINSLTPSPRTRMLAIRTI